MSETVQTRWGSYRVIFKGNHITVKELAIEPGKSMSMQRHFKRAEKWHVSSGVLWMRDEDNGVVSMVSGDQRTIEVEEWHQAFNAGDEVVKCIEVWIGESSEYDIERQSDKLQIKDSA